ncbi:hypothetical protein CR983_02820 [Candidatus Saccharibacteria bacterium]|nr:MAG: hypothetical protein CR983_02820 [Candidatus Saccharibacteria bacterium]
MNIYDLIIVQPIFNLLTLIYGLVPWGDFGIAIIIFTIIVRFAMYPLVRRQLHQTRKMRQLQPELKKIKQQAKGNRQLEAMQMMELYKRHGVSPFRTIGILFVQIPIFIGLFHAIQIYTTNRDAIARYTYTPLESFGPIAQLIEQPELFNEKLLGFVDLTKHAISAQGIDIVLVALAVFAGVTQYIMSKQTMPHQESKKTFRQLMSEAAEGKQTDQAEMNAMMMQNMMRIMPVFLVLVMLNLPAALALYYTVSNLVALVQQSYLLRQDEEELEEIADEPKPKTSPRKTKSTSAKKRESQAKKAHITRIKATDKKRRK